MIEYKRPHKKHILKLPYGIELTPGGSFTFYHRVWSPNGWVFAFGRRHLKNIFEMTYEEYKLHYELERK